MDDYTCQVEVQTCVYHINLVVKVGGLKLDQDIYRKLLFSPGSQLSACHFKGPDSCFKFLFSPNVLFLEFHKAQQDIPQVVSRHS